MAATSQTQSSSPKLLDLTINDDQETTLTDFTLVGRLITLKRVNHKAIHAVLQSVWNLGKNVVIKNIDINTITRTFKFETYRDKVLKMGPWAIKGATHNLIKWPSNLNLHELDFTQCLFWVQVHNVPPNRMNEGNVATIETTIGKFIRLDNTSPIRQAKSFFRVQILVDTTKSLKT